MRDSAFILVTGDWCGFNSVRKGSILFLRKQHRASWIRAGEASAFSITVGIGIGISTRGRYRENIGRPPRRKTNTRSSLRLRFLGVLELLCALCCPRRETENAREQRVANVAIPPLNIRPFYLLTDHPWCGRRRTHQVPVMTAFRSSTLNTTATSEFSPSSCSAVLILKVLVVEFSESGGWACLM